MLRLGPLIFALAAAPALAQTDNIVVTGRGLEQALGEDVFEMVVIDRERLAGSASDRLDEILRQVPGFQLFRRSDARSANPTSQGATLRALGGNASSRALLVLDGVPQTDPFGGWVSWPAFDPQRLGEARVLRGGGSGAHGPGALAGTIELFSALPSENDGATASAAYGSRDSLDLRAGYGAAFGGGFLSLSGSYARGDGFIPIVEEQRGPADRAAPYRQASASFRAVAPLSNALELQATGLWFRDRRERGTAFSDISTDGADASVRIVGNGAWRWSMLGYVQTRQFYNAFAAANAGRTSASPTAEQYAVPSTSLGARFEIRPPLGTGVELRIGGDGRIAEGETRERYNFQNGLATRRRVAGGRTATLGGFVEAGWGGKALTLNGGGRIDRWTIRNGKLEERVLAGGASLTDARFQDRSGWEATGRAGISYRPAEAVKVRAAAYFGWRMPTLNELYRPFRVAADAVAANDGLDPERLRGMEAGIEFRPFPNARIGVTAFRNRLKGAIANVTLGAGPGFFPGVGFVAAGGEYRQRQNLDAVDVRGVEVDAGLQLGAWSLSAGYGFAHAKVEADGAALPLDALRPAQTPRHTASGTLSWADPGGVRASVSARYTGAQFEDDLNAQRLPDALTFDVVAAIPLTRTLLIEARGENVGNEPVIAGISGAGIVERATPRTFWFGLRYRQ